MCNTEPFWLTHARKYIGLKEYPGKSHNSKILSWWKAIKCSWFKDDETPWCAGFVGGVLEEMGIDSSHSAAARSYLKWARKLNSPALGAIAVFERGPTQGHVGFVAGMTPNGHPIVVGGNQDNMVSMKAFDAARVLEYRWPYKANYSGANGHPFPEPWDMRPVPVLKGYTDFSKNEA